MHKKRGKDIWARELSKVERKLASLPKSARLPELRDKSYRRPYRWYHLPPSKAVAYDSGKGNIFERESERKPQTGILLPISAIVLFTMGIVFLLTYFQVASITGLVFLYTGNQTDWNTGTYGNTFYNTTSAGVELNTTLSNFGNYTSTIFNAGETGAVWSNISFNSSAFGETPANGTAETTFASGNLDMTSNLGLYHFNNDSTEGETNIIVNDYSGSSNHGTWQGGGSSNGSAFLGNYSGTFDGNADYVNLSLNDDSWEKSNWTIMAWVQRRAISPANNEHVAARFNSDGGKRNFQLGIETNNSWKFSTYSTCSGSATALYAGPVAKAGEWYHVTYVLNRSVAKLIYVNGTLMGSSTSQAALPASCGAQQTVIGSNLFNTATTAWDGLIDEVVIFNRTLTPGEIMNHYKRGATRLNLTVRSCDDSACNGETFTDIPDVAQQNLSLTANQFFQYQIFFNTTQSGLTPTLNNATIGYSGAAKNPSIFLEAPANNTENTTNVQPSFYFNVSDGDTALLDCDLWLNNSSGSAVRYGNNATVRNATSNTFIIPNASLANDRFFWWINCTDSTSSNISEQRNFSVNVEKTAPNVTNVLPASGTRFNVSSTIEIAATVIDSTAVNTVLANISYANGSRNALVLSLASGNKYNSSIVAVSVGDHDITFLANDSYNNINNSATTRFSIDSPLSFINETQRGHLGVTFNNTRYNTSINALQLNNTSLNGSFLSQIFDVGSASTWNNISWISSPVGQLPANQTIERTFPSSGLNMTGCVLYYRFENDSSYGENKTYVFDYCYTGNNGTVIGDPIATNSTFRMGNQSGVFDGSLDYFNSTTNDDSFASRNLTVVAWVLLKGLNPGNNRHIASRFRTASMRNFQVGMETNNTLNFATYTDCGGSVSALHSNTALTTDLWYHVAFVLENNVKKEIWMDGQLESNETAGTVVQTCGVQTTTIGANMNTPSSTTWNGLIDEVAIFNRTLSAQEITNHYRRGITRLNLSVRSCDDTSCSGESWTEMNDSSPQNISRALSDNRYFQYNFTFSADNYNLVNLTPFLYNVSINYNSSVASDLINPNVTTAVPAVNILYNITNIIEIAANVTDGTAVAQVYANITMPNGTLRQYQLNNGTGFNDKFNTSFTVPELTGTYNITYIANDSSNNINGSLTSNFTINLGCAVINRNVTLDRNVNGSYSCFSINASHLVVDCQRYLVNYSQSGFGHAFNNTRGFDNITIRNCRIMEGVSTAASQAAISFSGDSSNNTIYNNTIITVGTLSIGVLLNNTALTNISGNTITTTGESGHGIVLAATNSTNLTRNNVTSSGVPGYALYLTGTSANNTFLNNTFSGDDTYTIFDETPAESLNYCIFNNSYGDIRWTNGTGRGFLNNLSVEVINDVGFGLDRNIFLGNNTAAINTSAFINTFINSSANITLYNPNFTSVNQIITVSNFSTSINEIYSKGTNCSNNCFILSYSNVTGILLFNTSSFSSFSSNGTKGAVNTAPTVPGPVVPANATNTTNRTPTFQWYNSSDADLNPITYNLVIDDNSAFNNPEANVTNINPTASSLNTSYSISTELSVDTTYFWRVRANDSTDYGDWSSVSNFTVQSLLSVSFTTSIVNFSADHGLGEKNNTTDGSPPPFAAENIGNILANITINATSYFAQVPFPSTNYQYQVRANESNSINSTRSDTNITNMNNSDSTPNIVAFDWHEVSDTVLIDLFISVPNNETIGRKTSTITFTVES